MSIISLASLLHDLYKLSRALPDILFAASLRLCPKVFGFSLISSFSKFFLIFLIFSKFFLI